MKKNLLSLLVCLIISSRLAANDSPIAWIFVEGSANLSPGQTVTIKTSVADGDNGWIGRHLYYKGPGDSGWIGWSFEGVSGNSRDPGNPNSSAEWDRLWSLTLSDPGDWQFLVKAYDPGSSNDLGYDRWSNDAITTVHVTAAGQLPSVTWTSLPSAPAHRLAVGSQNGPQALGSDPDGDLNGVRMDISIDGGGWSPFAYAGGGNGFTAANGGNSFTVTGGSTYQFRVYSLSNDGNSDFLFSPVYVGAQQLGFKILIDTNQITLAEANQASLFSADGVWSFTVNSPDISHSIWPSIMAALRADLWTVSEDLFPDWGITDETQTFIGHNVNAQMVYQENNPAGNDTILLNSQIDAAAAARGNGIVVLTRSYAGERGDYIRTALDNPNCAGVVFETNPSPNQSDVMWTQSFNEGINYTLNRGKKCYVLLSGRSDGSHDYRGDIEAAMGYFVQSGQLNNPNLYFVVASYDRTTTEVGFVTGDHGSGSQHSITAAVNWLKAYRQGM